MYNVLFKYNIIMQDSTKILNEFIAKRLYKSEDNFRWLLAFMVNEFIISVEEKKHLFPF